MKAVYREKVMVNLVGTTINDVLVGSRSDDSIEGLSGADILIGGEGYDSLYGGSGLDVIHGGENNDYVEGGDGRDVISGGSAGDLLYGDSNGGSGLTSADVTTSNTTTIPASQQEFSVSLTAPDASSATSYSISGFVSTSAVTSNDVNVALVVDVSGSTGSTYTGTAVGDLNGDGYANTILDGEIAGSIALINSIIDAGFGNAMVNLITFESYIQKNVTMQANADVNNNGILDLEEELRSLNDLGGTNFEPPLQEAITFFNSRPAGQNNYVFFLSDGVPSSTTNYADEVTTLIDPAGINATIQAFPIGAGASEQSLDLLDDGVDNDSAPRITDPGALSAAITGGGITAADVLEVQVYVNGQLEQTIPSANLVATPFGLKYEVDLTGLSSSNPEDIQVVAVATDGANTTVSTSQIVENLSNDGNDTMFGDSGSDTMFGEGGNDILHGGIGNDGMDGGLGNDSLFGGEGNDELHGGLDADVIYGNAGSDIAYGDGGSDYINGGWGNDTLLGNAGNDTVVGGNGRDRGVLGAGDDVFIDNAEVGVNGNDTVVAGSGNDTIQGGGGDDLFFGEEGDDNVSGGGGDDTLSGGSGADTLNAGDGNDVVDGGEGTDLVYLGIGNDLFEDNTESGAAGSDTVYAGLGNDTIEGGHGNDVFYGVGGNDLIYGRAENDALFGGSGADTLDGGFAADTLNGGGGNDELTGGAGRDTFVFFSGSGNDHVTDYELAYDRLQLNGNMWTGDLTAAEVVAAYGVDNGATVSLDFGTGDVVTFDNISTLTGLELDITII